MAIDGAQARELRELGFSSLQEACTKHKQKLNLVYDRWIRHGWPLEKALLTPGRRNHSERVDQRERREEQERLEGLRLCLGGCAKTKPLEEFRPATNSSNGRDRYCFECRYFYNTEKTYGLTRELFSSFWESQEGRCFGCREVLRFTPQEPRGVTFHVEHDHRTGKIRGLACIGCNSAISAFAEDPTRLRRAIEWVDTVCPVDPLSWSGAVKSTCTGPTRAYTLWHNHGLTPSDFDRMLAQQGGVCGICLRVPRTKKGWAVDHSHARRGALLGQTHVVNADGSMGWRSEQEVAAYRASVRGVLCDECNKGLGQVKENKTTLIRLAELFEVHS